MQTKQQARELLHTQLNVKDQNDIKENYSNEQLINRKQIKDTPFTIITVANNNHIPDYEGDISFGTIGKYRLTENKKSSAEVEDELTDFSWELVLKLLTIIIPAEIERILAEISINNHKQHTEENNQK